LKLGPKPQQNEPKRLDRCVKQQQHGRESVLLGECRFTHHDYFNFVGRKMAQDSPETRDPDYAGAAAVRHKLGIGCLVVIGGPFFVIGLSLQ
jgi:hypothetical protein